MAKKKALTRGLDAIFNDGATGTDLQSAIDAIEKKPDDFEQERVDIASIRPNPYQPRKLFDQDKLEELASSIKKHGIFQPLLLKKSIHGFEIVAGERRYRAAKIAGLEEVPAIIVDFTDNQMMEIALLENIQRENLNAIEEAQAYQSMMYRLNLTQEKLSERIGKSRTHIANTLRLLQLDKEIQNYILDGSLTMGHVRPLVGLPDEKAKQVAKRAIDEKLSVRRVEDIVKGMKLSEKKAEKKKNTKDKKYDYAEGLLRKKYHTNIKIDDKTITIKYKGNEDLNRLLELMGVIEDI
jgi:ParB family chromosome partitioning protein